MEGMKETAESRFTALSVSVLNSLSSWTYLGQQCSVLLGQASAQYLVLLWSVRFSHAAQDCFRFVIPLPSLLSSMPVSIQLQSI